MLWIKGGNQCLEKKANKKHLIATGPEQALRACIEVCFSLPEAMQTKKKKKKDNVNK